MVKSTKILLATHNPGKLAYFKQATADLPFTFISLADCQISTVAQETGTTLKENALIKATLYGQLSGLITIADDSGLFIDALNGNPGVNTAEYGGKNLSDQERIAYLLERLKDIPDAQRTAHFKSVIALYFPDKTASTHEGILHGIITHSPRGNPVAKLPFRQLFLIPELNKTLDELGLHSNYERHRATAFAQAINRIQAYLRNN